MGKNNLLIKNKNVINFQNIFVLIILIIQFFYIINQNCLSFNCCQDTLTKNITFANFENKTSNGKQLTLAKSMVAIESNSGRILYAKNENEKLPMASTTKIITAIVAIENCDNLDEKHLIPKQAVGIEGSSIYLRANEHLSIRELLYGLMLRSGNDSAVAIAIIIGGSVDGYVKMMNDFCVRHKLLNTHIVTVNGLHDNNHYTTASDLAMATSYALKNKIFAEIVSTKKINISDENAKDGTRYLVNKNKLLKMLDGADGVKTGYTTKSGKCYVGSATKNKMQVVCVLLDSPNMFDDCKKIIEQAFNEFSMTKLFSKGTLCETEIFNSSKKNPIILKSDIFYPLKKNEMCKIKAKVNFYDNLKLPITSSDEIGELEIKLENDLIFSQKIYTIYTSKTKEENPFKKIIRFF